MTNKISYSLEQKLVEFTVPNTEMNFNHHDSFQWRCSSVGEQPSGLSFEVSC